MRIIIILLLTINSAHAITVEEAYRSIPHQQTTYKASLTNNKDARTLEKLFELVDQAIVQKVEASNYIRKQGGTAYSSYQQKISAIINSINLLSIDDKIKSLIGKAIEEQSLFLKKQNLNFSDPLVTSSSNKLKAAYSELMRAYSQEPQVNKKAFFDHLCALDFI